jgi:hypothetical protein
MVVHSAPPMFGSLFLLIFHYTRLLALLRYLA